MYSNIILRFENRGNKRYMIYQKRKEDQVSQLELSILRRNVSGEFYCYRRNAMVEYGYDVTDMIDLCSYIEQEGMTEDFFYRLFQSLAECLRNMQEYYLSIDHILGDFEYIYWNPKENKIQLYCIPIENPQITKISLAEFCRNLSAVFHGISPKEIPFYNELQQFLMHRQFVTPKALLEIVNDWEQKLSIPEKHKSLRFKHDKKEKVFSGKMYLEHMKKKERIYLQKDSMILGRNSEYADYVIQNPTIGRIHLLILRIEGKAYVIDMKSKNGTFLNGKQMDAMMYYEIKKGDILKLGKEKYRWMQES